MQIRYLTSADTSAAKLVADANRDTLGFLPRKKLEEAAEQKRCFVAVDDEAIVGFVIFRHRKIDDQTTLSDICVDVKCRRQRIGASLVERLIADCEERKRAFILLKCPEDLDANLFYERLGFKPQNVEPGKSRRLKVWLMPITEKVEN
jgi:ribosomal protein S18 acetylase RimI-like enzyme